MIQDLPLRKKNHDPMNDLEPFDDMENIDDLNETDPMKSFNHGDIMIPQILYEKNHKPTQQTQNFDKKLIMEQ